jgi:hypothetical protein
MADKSVFSLDLETQAFDKFKRDFDDYSQKLSGTVAGWKQAAKAINDAKAAVTGLNQGMARMQASMRPLTVQMRDYTGTVRQALGYWREIATITGQIAGNVNTAAAASQRMRTGGGVIEGRLAPQPRALPPPTPTRPPTVPSSHQPPPGFNFGAVMVSIQGSMQHTAREIGGIGKAITSQVFGTGGAASAAMGSTINSVAASLRGGPIAAAISAAAALAGGLMAAPFMVAPGVAALRRQSLGMAGVGINQLRAAGAASSWMMNPEGALAGIMTARRDITSDERRAMGNLFRGRTQEELAKSKTAPGQVMFEALREARKQLLAMPEASRDTMANTLGYSGLLGAGNLRAVQTMSDEELAQHQSRWANIAQQTKTTPAQDRAWFDFYDKMNQAGALMESALIKHLAPLQQPLADLMDSFVKFAQSPVMDDLVQSFGNLLKGIKPEQVEKGVEGFVTGLADMYKAMAGFVSWANAAAGYLNAFNNALQDTAKWLHVHLGIAAVEHKAATAERSATGHSAAPLPGVTHFLERHLGRPFHTAEHHAALAQHHAALAQAAAAPFRQPPHPHTPTPLHALSRTPLATPSATPPVGRAAPAHHSWLGGLFHRTAYEGGGDDYHQYIQKASFLDNPIVKKGRQAYSWYGKFTGNPASSTLSATSEALLFQKYVLPLIKGYGGAAATGLGIAAAPAMTGPLTAGGMKGAIASDDANRAQFYRLLNLLRGGEGGGSTVTTKDQVKEQQKTNDILTDIKLGATKASAAGGDDWHKYISKAAYVTGGDGATGGGDGGAGGGAGGGDQGGGGQPAMPGMPSLTTRGGGGILGRVRGMFGGGFKGGGGGGRGGGFKGGGGSSGGGGASGGWGDPGVAAPHLKANRKAVASLVASEFEKAGASKEGVAGMFANIGSESGFNPAIMEKGGTGLGLWQFSGTTAGSERGRMLKWMKDNNKDWRDPKAQTDYQIQNLQKNYPKLWAEMKTHASSSSQATAYLKDYERPRADYLAQRAAKYGRGVPDVASYTGGGETAVASRLPARPVSRTPNPPQGGEAPSVAVSNPLGMGNWQAAPKPSISLHNKTGSDVFINSSTTAV